MSDYPGMIAVVGLVVLGVLLCMGVARVHEARAQPKVLCDSDGMCLVEKGLLQDLLARAARAAEFERLCGWRESPQEGR